MTNPIIVETIHVAPPDGRRSTGGGSIPVVPVEPLRPPQSPVDAALAKTRKVLSQGIATDPTHHSLDDYGLGGIEQK